MTTEYSVPSTEYCDVAIVGGGPVGLGLAVELGRHGIDVVLVEKHERLHSIPKGQNLTQRTMEHFRAWGVEDEIRAAREMPPGYPAAGVNAFGTLLSGHAHPWFRRSQVGEYYHAANERLPQYRTEHVLRSRIEGLASVEARYGFGAEGIEQYGDTARVHAGGATIEARYVVGCDGSRSLVRSQAGITESISEHDRRMVLLVFRSKELHELLEARFEHASFFNVLDPTLDGYWRFLGRVDVGERWFFHAPVDAGASADSIDPAAILTSTVGADFSVTLDHVGFWDLRIATADTYRAGRVLIAGDAAHSHPPYGGYGINTGFEDARNLGWKLRAELEGWAGPGLLDSYTEERRAVFLSTARDLIEAFIDRDRAFIAAHDPDRDPDDFASAWEARRTRSVGVTDFVPHYEGSPIVLGPPDGRSGAIGTHTFAALAGHHLSPRRRSAGDPIRPDDTAFTLIAGDQGAASAFVDVASDLGVPLVVERDDFRGESADYGAECFLVRPDGFVAWVDAGGRRDPRGLLRAATGHR